MWYLWGYNPLILTFDPNFQQKHPSSCDMFHRILAGSATIKTNGRILSIESWLFNRDPYNHGLL